MSMRALSRVAFGDMKNGSVFFHPDSAASTVNLAIDQFQVFPILMKESCATSEPGLPSSLAGW